jgi:hypothetical protein
MFAGCEPAFTDVSFDIGDTEPGIAEASPDMNGAELIKQEEPPGISIDDTYAESQTIDGISDPTLGKKLPDKIYTDFGYNIVWNHHVIRFELYEHTIEIIQVDGMEDMDLQQQINNTILTASTLWLNPSIFVNRPYANPNTAGLYSNTLRYLCIKNFYPGYPKFFEWGIYDYIMIDMQTGERIMLNDLVDVGDEFIHNIQTGRIVRGTGDAPIFFHDVCENLWEWLEDMPTAELSERIEECSKTMEEVIARNSIILEYITGTLIHRNSFYIEPGVIVLWFYGGGQGNRLTIALDDIEEFMKVPKW